MKKLIATVLLTLMFVTVGLPLLQSFLPETGGYIDRKILCRWIGAAERDRPMLEAVAAGEPICPETIAVRPHYQYGKNCVRTCEPLAIADQIFESAKETAVAIEESLRLLFTVRS